MAKCSTGVVLLTRFIYSLMVIIIMVLSACGYEKNADKSTGKAVYRFNSHNLKTPRSLEFPDNYDPHKNLKPVKIIQIALQHQDENRIELAIETLNQAIEKYPNDVTLYSVRGSIYLQQKQYSVALADLNKALDLNPRNLAALSNRAQVYKVFGRIEEAVMDLDNAIKMDKNFVAAIFNRGSIAFNSGQYEHALADFNTCIKLNPKTSIAYFNRASVHYAMGNRKSAIVDMKYFLAMDPSEIWQDAAKALLQKWQAFDTTQKHSAPS